MDIYDYNRKRRNLRSELCGKVAGHVDFIREKRSVAGYVEIFLDGVIADVVEYRTQVAALDAEYEKVA